MFTLLPSFDNEDAIAKCQRETVMIGRLYKGQVSADTTNSSIYVQIERRQLYYTS